MARGQDEIADLAARAERAQATARDLHLAAKVNIVRRLAQDDGGLVADAEDVGLVASEQATHDGRFEKRLAHSDNAPRLARHGLVEWLAGSLSREDEQRAKLAVSELVTNAATHGSGEITMRADLNHDRLRVEVIDQGTSFAYQRPEVRLEQLPRRGLAIVDAITSRWGIREGTTCVWFELERTDPQVRHCAGCGERVGAYEPLWQEQPDGTFLLTSLLNLNEHQQDGRQPRLFHNGCLPENLPAASG